ncbi:hypothetical protein RhiirA5_430786 [Rhizophagus irregularis]|uniref:Uncharacterized protein n=1 Tax=Rhizophagus irregularis TaxID=588596 RepID=A0A2N0NW84_9GLOM|nr:hypothetical protein RhiirA5_430786 [Rhizophagus irregularis]
MTYAVCLSCNTLYNIADIVKSCGIELTVQVPHGNGNKRCPKLLFPLLNLKIQINSLYQRPEFKQQLRKWTNRDVNNGILADIYDATSNENRNKSNFGSFDYIIDWFVERDLDEHRWNAELWRLCKPEEERKRHVSSTHVR